MANDDLKELLIRGAGELGIALSDDQIASCSVYFAELKKWNRKINLTAIRDDREIIIKHFIDSFSYKTGFVTHPGISLLDMGSGAGFPALPIKIAVPEATVSMVESVQKKAAFLRHIIRTLKLSGVGVWEKRIGDLPSSLHDHFDVVTARAFASMENAIAEAHQFLKPGGVMVLSRGPEETIHDGAPGHAGILVVSRTDMTLPLSDYRRVLWVFQKKG